jgi:hypothetical protein
MFAHRDAFARQGVAFFATTEHVNSYNPLFKSILRDQASSGGVPNTNPQYREERREQLRAGLAAFCARYPDASLLVSAETISLLRTDTEMEQLLSLLPHGYAIHTILVMREKDDWWASYSNQIRKKGQDRFARPGSPYDLDPNGWLLDFDTLRDVLKRHSDTFTEVPYQRDIVPSLLAAMNLTPPADYVQPVRNVRVSGWRFTLQRVTRPLYKWLRVRYGQHVRVTKLGAAWRDIKLKFLALSMRRPRL